MTKTAVTSQMRINRECFFDQNLSKNKFWGRNRKIEKLSPDLKSAPSRYHDCQFSGKTDNFNFFGPNLPKNEI